MVAPFLLESSVGTCFFKSVEFQSGNGLDPFAEGREGVDVDNGTDFLGFLGSVVEDSVFGLGDGLLFVSGEEHEFVDIVLESVFIEFQRFLGSILSTMVDCDSDRSSELDAESSGFDFSESESWSYDEAYLCLF